MCLSTVNITNSGTILMIMEAVVKLPIAWKLPIWYIFEAPVVVPIMAFPYVGAQWALPTHGLTWGIRFVMVVWHTCA